MPTCAECGSIVFRGDETAYKWQHDWYCGIDCAHEAGDRTQCLDVLECNCTAYSKLHRAIRGFLFIRNRQRTRLAAQGHLTESDFNMRLGRYENLPYEADDAMLEDLMDGQRDSDDLNPDRAARDAEVRRTIVADSAADTASLAAFVEVAAVMAQSDDMRQQRDDARMQLEDARMQLRDARMQLEDVHTRLDARLQLEDARLQQEDSRLQLERLRSRRST